MTDIHHGCQCHACGRLLKRHRGKRNCCKRSLCRYRMRAMSKATRSPTEPTTDHRSRM